jgi:2-iminobutanoate/2-iminopropanoate deaminase
VQEVPRHWNPAEVAAPVGKYSHLAEVPPGHRLLFISGQVGNTPDGRLVGPDASAQTQQALVNIETLLTSEGATPANILRLQSFVAGKFNLDGFRQGLSATYERWFPDGQGGYPGHSLLVVQALAGPDIWVEIEGWFTLPPHAASSQGV